MPRIDPEKLLTCLSVLLAQNGGIRSSKDVKRLAGLMAKFSKKLVSKCIYIQILKCTETDLLCQFMTAGGWSLSHMWLTDGILTKNWPLVQEILELLLLCPVDVQRLKSNSSPKLVKGLSKEGGNEAVRILASKLVEQWLKFVKSETLAETPKSISSSAAIDSAATLKAENIEETAEQQQITDSNADKCEQQEINAANEIANNSDESAVNTTNELNESTKPKTLIFKFSTKDGKQVFSNVDRPSSVSPVKQKSIDSISGSSPKRSSSEIVSDDGKSESDDTSKIKSKSISNKSSSSSSKSSGNKDRKSDKDRDRSKHRDKDDSSSRLSSSSSSSKHKSSSRHSSSSSNHKSSSHKSSSSKSNTSSESSRDGIKLSSSSSSRDKTSKSSHRDKDSKNSSTSSSSSKSSSHDKDKLSSSKSSSHREKEKVKSSDKVPQLTQEEIDKDTLAKMTMPSINKLGKIPKKVNKDDSETVVPAAKKPSISIEVRKDTENRPKTVKTFNSKFRSHGLAEEAPPPPSRKDLKRPTAAVATSPTTSVLKDTPLFGSNSLKRSSPPPSSKDEIIQKKMKLDAQDVQEKPGGIKLIAPQKPPRLMESDMFMDALSASTTKKDTTRKRKRKLSLVNTKDGTPSDSKIAAVESTAGDAESGASTPTVATPTTPDKVAAEPLKFYQDTLDAQDTKENDDEDTNVERDASNEKNKDNTNKEQKENDKKVNVANSSTDQKLKSADELTPEDVVTTIDEPPPLVLPPERKPPGPGCGPDGPPGVLVIHRRKGPKKQLKWRPQESLEDIRYFELDENERVNVTKTFGDMQQLDRCNEREAFIIARKLSAEDTMAEQCEWKPLIEVDDVITHPYGQNSEELKIQQDRERTVLKALYFNRLMIPDSPAEPDMEQYKIIDPAIIPFEDVTGSIETTNNFTNMPWPEPKGSPPHTTGSFNDPQSFNNFGAPLPFAPFNALPPGPVGGGGGNWSHQPPIVPPPFDVMSDFNSGPPKNIPALVQDHGFNNGPGPGFNNFGPRPGMDGPPHRMHGPRGGGGGGGGNGGWFRQNPTMNNKWRHQMDNNGQPPKWLNRNRICKSFQKGYCHKGDTCGFLHPGINCPPF